MISTVICTIAARAAEEREVHGTILNELLAAVDALRLIVPYTIYIYIYYNCYCVHARFGMSVIAT